MSVTDSYERRNLLTGLRIAFEHESALPMIVRQMEKFWPYPDLRCMMIYEVGWWQGRFSRPGPFDSVADARRNAKRKRERQARRIQRRLR